MIAAYWHQFQMWLKSMTRMVPMPLMVMSSPAWRMRNHHANLILTNPLWERALRLSALLSDPLEVVLVPVRSDTHNTSELELLALGSMVAQLKATNVFEIGTFDGRTTRTLAANIAPEGRVWTLNLPPGQDANDSGKVNVDSQLNLKVTSGCRFAGTSQAASITQLYGDSANFDFSPHVEMMDMVFIDGSHTKEYVANDTAVALRLLSPAGGLVVWHDAPYYGVVEYLKERIAEGWPLHWIEGTTLAVAYVKNGQPVPIPSPLSRSSPMPPASA